MSELQATELATLHEVFFAKSAPVSTVLAIGSQPDFDGRDIQILATDPLRAKIRFSLDERLEPFRERISVVRVKLLSPRVEMPAGGTLTVGETLAVFAGSAIGASPEASGGTMGATLIGSNLATEEPAQPYFLTAQHVLGEAPSAFPSAGQTVSLAVSLTAAWSFPVGSLRFHGDLFGAAPVADWALVSPLRATPQATSRCDERRYVLPPRNSLPAPGTPVYKCGAQTPLRQGLVELHNIPAFHAFPRNGKLEQVRLPGQIQVIDPEQGPPFATDGDSGSLVYRIDNQDRAEVVGMLIQLLDKGKRYLVTPIHTILDDIKEKTGLDLTFAT